MSNKKFRGFCFTDFILDDKFYDDLYDKGGVKYIVAGKETCPETGKTHLQGYIYFKSARTLNSVLKLLKPRHTEVCKGNIEQNYKYCTKENDFKEWGKKPSQGERVDLVDIKNEIVAGKKVEDICLEDPNLYHQYGRTLHKIEDIVKRKKERTEMTKGIWYYGKSGVGKSFKAFEQCEGKTRYVHNINDGGWWDNYDQEEFVIINEFRGQIQYSELLDLADRWPKTVRRRCREPLNFVSKTIIITSSMHPKDIYKNIDAKDNLEQLFRRFDIYEVKMCKGIRTFTLINDSNKFSVDESDEKSSTVVDDNNNTFWQEVDST